MADKIRGRNLSLSELADSLSWMIPSISPDARENLQNFYSDKPLADAFSSKSDAQNPGTEEDYKNSILDQLFAGGSDYNQISKPYGQARQDYFNSGNMTYPGRTGDDANFGMGQYSDPESGNAYEGQELEKLSAILGIPGRIVSKSLGAIGVRDPIPELGNAITPLARPVQPGNSQAEDERDFEKYMDEISQQAALEQSMLEAERMDVLKKRSLPGTEVYTGNSEGAFRGDGSEITDDNMKGGNFSKTKSIASNFVAQDSPQDLARKFGLNPSQAYILSRQLASGDSESDVKVMDKLFEMAGKRKGTNETLAEANGEAFKKSADMIEGLKYLRQRLELMGMSQELIDQQFPLPTKKI